MLYQIPLFVVVIDVEIQAQFTAALGVAEKRNLDENVAICRIIVVDVTGDIRREGRKALCHVRCDLGVAGCTNAEKQS